MKQDNLDTRFLTKPETLARVRLSGSTVDRLEAKGLFPRRVKLGLRKVGWSLASIEAWERNRPTSSVDLSAA
ncbi:MAG: AlpA family phage regulatory protein [Bosea sp.]|uniref:helix-turn-helix transcriptional regulator n=1 Tax=Bosea sp. (in: a-proteobacteria) TaxID=1871050 RepID=UPI001AD4CBAC|nr:AlpA family phage regulatory protein [Bosea sp. (in: a-proteobacteria)]MBN9470648.1 AlpA family phage regulatory protein [Bosea sp. (in: a-proteobacteria)]